MLTTKQAADRLHMDVTRVRRLCKAGRLKADKIGRDWLIDEQSVAQFTKAKRGRPRTAR